MEGTRLLSEAGHLASFQKGENGIYRLMEIGKGHDGAKVNFPVDFAVRDGKLTVSRLCTQSSLWKALKLLSFDPSKPEELPFLFSWQLDTAAPLRLKGPKAQAVACILEFLGRNGVRPSGKPAENHRNVSRGQGSEKPRGEFRLKDYPMPWDEFKGKEVIFTVGK